MFTPRWKVREEKKKGRQNPLCCIRIPGCTTKFVCNCRFATFDTICNAVEVSASIAEGSIVSPFPLCMPHYQSVYKYCHPSQKCVCCGRIQKHQVSLIRFRQCSDPMKVEMYLKETGYLEEPISHDALLCTACEVFFNHPSNNYLSESNESIIKELNEKVFELKQHLEVDSTEEKHALLQTALYLGECMLNDKAFTFPQIYQQFCYFLETVSDDTSLSVSRWKVLTYIGNEFWSVNIIQAGAAKKRLAECFIAPRATPLLYFHMLWECRITMYRSKLQLST